MQSIDQRINNFIGPLADWLNSIVLYEIQIADVRFPWIVAWLLLAALFFTVYFGFINVTGLKHSIQILRGDSKKSKGKGEITHFQALATALSGTVGIGNIGGVAIVISIGGPGAMFWLVVAGFLSMSTKFIECILGVKYRRNNLDGSVSGGPMFYLENGLREKGMNWLAKPLGVFYAIAMVVGCLGIGNMFQSNQAFEQFSFLVGAESFLGSNGWLFGLILAFFVGLVVLGGIRSIAKVTGRLVPFMAVSYVVVGLLIIGLNYQKVPWAVEAVFTNAFSPDAMTGGVVAVIVLGFKRALFSNEAGIGSAAIAHSAVKTDEPVTEGYMGLLEPFIDTIVICSITAMVILTTVYDPSVEYVDIQGVQLTAQAFEGTIRGSVVPLSIIAILFAFSTIISWSYYGLKGWTYLFGEHLRTKKLFLLIFCIFVAIGCSIQLEAVLDFSDAMVYLVALPNIIGLYILAPIVKKELKGYRERLKANKD